MAFVAEDGTGLETANSLCDVAFADAYFADRQVTTWATKTDGTARSEADKQGALIRATDYVEGRWAAKFAGYELLPAEQALSFPRMYIGWDGAVPDGIKRAVSEYALRALAGVLAPDPTMDASGVAVGRVKKKVGPIETEIEYAGGAVYAPFKPYPAADMLVRPFLRPGGGVLRG